MSTEKHPRHRRVRKRADFTRAYADGRKVVLRPFVLFACPNGGRDSRLGVTATRKLGNAAVRNRAKRLIREAFRKTRQDIPGSRDYVVVVRRPLLRMGPEEVKATLVAAARRATDPGA